jgi:transposase InsO family protein
LELEGHILTGSVYRSSLQRHLQKVGFGAKQIRMYAKTGVAARRFQKEHRCQLWQGDVKFGPYLPIGKNGEKKQVYLAAWIDDCSRYIVAAKFYANQKVEIIEDSLRNAVTHFGKPDSVYVDNGKIYRSKWLVGACAKMGIRLIHAKPYSSESKGKIEAFNRRIDSFLSEAALSGAKTLEELNQQLSVWIEEYYHKNPHSGLSGISPETAFRSDSRPLRFLDAKVVRDAFLHRDTREVDKVGCINFNGKKYEVGMALIGRKVEVYSDPTWQDEVSIHHPDFDPFIAKVLEIGPFSGARKELPSSLQQVKPTSSRLLDALEKKDQDTKSPAAIATTFRNQMGGDDNV